MNSRWVIDVHEIMGYLKTRCQALAIDTLKDMVLLYPSLLRALSSSITDMCHRILNGSAPQRTNTLLLHSAASLYAALHYTGGKVGAANLWKKSVDETLQCLWAALMGLRTTFPGRSPILMYQSLIDLPCSGEQPVTVQPTISR
jgi:hypothetical protein